MKRARAEPGIISTYIAVAQSWRAATQEQWFSLEKQDRIAVLNCFVNMAALEWDAIYRDKGLRWELIQSRTGVGKERLYSIRITQKIRSVVKRQGDFLEFLTLHVDLDSAYH